MKTLLLLFPALLLGFVASLRAAPPAEGKNLGAIWFVGDSITQSNADGDPQGSPRKSLYDLLVAGGYTFSFTGHHKANPDGLPATGDTPATDLYRFHSGISGSVIGDNAGGRTGMTKNLPVFWKTGRLATVKPAIILIMLGTNDVNSGIDPKHAPERLKKFVQAIGRLPKAGRPAIFIATIPPNRSHPTMPEKTAAYNAALGKVVADLRAEGDDTTLVDMFTPLDAEYGKMMRKDNLHPDAEGDHVIARAWMTAIEKHAASKNPRSAPAEAGVKVSSWSGYEKLDFKVDGRPALLVKPKRTAPGAPWIWRPQFFGVFAQADAALLAKGWHVAYIELGNTFGAPKAIAMMEKYYAHVTARYGLSKRPVIEGISRGGLFAFNWAVAHPDLTAGLYVDAPVCDFKSWPGGKGKSKGAKSGWKAMIESYGFANDDEALAYKLNPVDNLAPLAKAKIPILAVVGDADDVVPVAENTAIVEKRYKALGGDIKVIHKPGVGHHPHSLSDPTPIVNWALKTNASGN